MRTSCQDVIKLQQNDATDGGGKRRKNERREDIAEEVADATNEVEINANFREESRDTKLLQGTRWIRAKGPRGKLSQRTTTGQDRAVEGEGRTWRGAGVDETGSWKSRGETMAGRRLRGRLINFFAFFDPHKLCRYTTTRRFAAGVKGLGFFPGERDAMRGCGGEREVAPERTPRMYS